MKTEFISPLRYPGGKAKLGPYFARLLADQSQPISAYAEPYAGGAGAGLYLLAQGYIDRLLINDLNPGICAFWRSITEDADDFVWRIENVALNVETWHQQRDIYLNPANHSQTDLGFATFFLNRCNRSGILSARPIGGLQQTGRWLIDARFNRAKLAQRVLRIQEMADSIEVSGSPALDFIDRLSSEAEPVLVYVDPPYLVKGEELYMSSQTWVDHEDLASRLAHFRQPWVLTYDKDQRIRTLYPYKRCIQYSISHTAQIQGLGQEFMLFGPGLKIRDLLVSSNREARWA